MLELISDTWLEDLMPSIAFYI